MVATMRPVRHWQRASITLAATLFVPSAAFASTCLEHVAHKGEAMSVQIFVENQSARALDLVLGRSANVTDANTKSRSYQELSAASLDPGAAMDIREPIPDHADHVFWMDVLNTPNTFRVQNQHTKEGGISWFRGDSLNLDYWEVNEADEIPYLISCDRSWDTAKSQWIVRVTVTDQAALVEN
ncbi:MAG: hypothetical protein AAF582_13710 [Pseudomonadota bacterium]